MSEHQNEDNQEQQHGRTFNPHEHLIQLKNRNSSADYLPVQWRLVWFREVCPHGTIDTEELEVDLDREMVEEAYVWNSDTRRSEKVVKRAKGYARYKATVTDGKGGRATGTKSEKAVSFPDYIEKAETGAIGRALAALGYGTQFAGDEFDERHRIVDAPVDRGAAAQPEHNSPEPAPLTNGRTTAMNGRARSTSNGTQRPADETDPQSPMTEQQRSSLHKLHQHLGKAEPQTMENMTYLAAKELIAQLSQEYRQSRSKAS